MKKILLTGAGSLVIFFGLASGPSFAASPSAVGSSVDQHAWKSPTLLRVGATDQAGCMSCIPLSGSTFGEGAVNPETRLAPTYLASAQMAIPHTALPLKAFDVDAADRGQSSDLPRTFLLVATALAAFGLIRRRDSGHSAERPQSRIDAAPNWTRKWLERPTQGSA
jgi:hypothetical protein